jgi:hypothetical protein
MTETLRLAGRAGASALESSAVVVGFVAACEAAGLSSLNLDEIVHDIADDEAAERHNSGAGPTTVDTCADAGAAHDLLSRDAVNVNNGGLASQIAYLIAALGRSQTKADLRTLGVRTS